LETADSECPAGGKVWVWGGTTCFFQLRTKPNVVANQTTQNLVDIMDEEPSEEYLVLKNALASKTDPTEAAAAFTKTARDAHAAGELVESYLWDAWADMIDIACETPHQNQEPLVKIMQAIQKQNLTDRKTGEIVKNWDGRVWQDLPIFGPQVRERWNRGIYSTAPMNVESFLTVDSA
jgi:hypothetical protein